MEVMLPFENLISGATCPPSVSDRTNHSTMGKKGQVEPPPPSLVESWKKKKQVGRYPSLPC